MVSEGFGLPDTSNSNIISWVWNHSYCVNDRNKYKLYGGEGKSSGAAVLLELKPCNNVTRATCNTNLTEV